MWVLRVGGCGETVMLALRLVNYLYRAGCASPQSGTACSGSSTTQGAAHGAAGTCQPAGPGDTGCSTWSQPLPTPGAASLHFLQCASSSLLNVQPAAAASCLSSALGTRPFRVCCPLLVFAHRAHTNSHQTSVAIAHPRRCINLARPRSNPARLTLFDLRKALRRSVGGKLFCPARPVALSGVVHGISAHGFLPGAELRWPSRIWRATYTATCSRLFWLMPGTCALRAVWTASFIGSHNCPKSMPCAGGAA